MIIVCQRCNTQFTLEDRRVKGTSFTARCSRCNYIFTAFKSMPREQIPFVDLEFAKQRPAGNVITFSNQKGGVAKTSTCLNLGSSLAVLGKKVLLIDFDAQANMTISLGYRDTASFNDLLSSRSGSLSDLIIETRYPNLSLIPANRSLVLLNKRYFGAQDFEYLLKDRLNGILDNYDFILIDTPPSIDFFTLNALTVSRLAIIPTHCDYLATHGVDQILRMIGSIRERTNPDIQVKILITMYDESNPISKLIGSKIGEMYGDKLFKTIIAHDIGIREAQILSMPVIYYNKEYRSGLEYMDLAKEMLNGVAFATRSTAEV